MPFRSEGGWGGDGVWGGEALLLVGIHLSSGLNFCVGDKQKLTNMILTVCPLEYLHNIQVINEFDGCVFNVNFEK